MHNEMIKCGVHSEIMLTEKIVCAKCKPVEMHKYRLVDNSKPLLCSSCERIIVCCSNKAIDLNRRTIIHDDYSLALPARTKFFHINKDLLYDAGNYQSKDFYENKAILLVGCGNIEGTSVLMNLKRMNFKLKVNLVRKKCWTEEFFDDSIIAEHEHMYEKESTLTAIKTYMLEKNVKFDAILTFSDDSSVLMVSYLSDQLGCLGIPYNVANVLRNKYGFRNYCCQSGIPTPKYILFNSDRLRCQVDLINRFLSELDDKSNGVLKKRYLEEITNLQIPFIMKNPYGCGKDFIRKCADLEEYRDFILESMRFGLADLLIEEFYDGEEIDLDILVCDNRVVFVGISDNFAQNEPNFYEKGVITPSTKLSSEEKQTIEQIVSRWIPKLNLKDACCNLEAFCRPKRLYSKNNFDIDRLDDPDNVAEFLMPIEINLRMGGAEKCSMILAAYGLNIFNSSIHLKLGLKPYDFQFLQHNPRFNCMSRKYFPKKSKIESITVDIGNLVNAHNVVDLALVESVGQTLSDNDYIGWMAIKEEFGQSYEHIMQTLDTCMDLVKFTFEDA